jgi:tRNA threonylcarbamoyl adenosine modification protein YeaZ
MPDTTLVIDTAFESCQVGVWQDDTCITMASVPGGGKHDIVLATLVDEIFNVHKIAVKDLSRVVVTTGPGRFTGLRVGVAYARGLVLVNNTPLIGVKTTDALRCQLDQAHPHLAHAAIIVTVKRGESFVQRRDQGIDQVPDTELQSYLKKHSVTHIAGVISGEAFDIIKENKDIIFLSDIAEPSLPAIYQRAALTISDSQEAVRPYYAA